jgi:hypothetical protein
MLQNIWESIKGGLETIREDFDRSTNTHTDQAVERFREAMASHNYFTGDHKYSVT